MEAHTKGWVVYVLTNWHLGHSLVYAAIHFAFASSLLDLDVQSESILHVAGAWHEAPHPKLRIRIHVFAMEKQTRIWCHNHTLLQDLLRLGFERHCCSLSRGTNASSYCPNRIRALSKEFLRKQEYDGLSSFQV